ncbi:MAG: DNA primase [Clostridia bacterium]|nr:DNA primase [Clostridia bacterium]
MASRYPAGWLDELRSRSDIVQVISGYVGLKKSGRNYWGLCPFHGEKTASFSVDEEHQLFYCFGCKAGGDVIRFIMEIERCSFQEAVELLAERAHIPMPEMVNDPEYEQRRSRRERLLEINRRAARYYHELLFQPEGAASLAYLRRRGLSDSMIRKFGLGAAPDQWSWLTDRLQGDGFSLDDLSAVGLTVVKKASDGSGKKHAFDMFRNRAIFPIIDMYKNVIAFGGRSLGKQEPKYLNTSDTPVFNKRKGVYAANLLRSQRHLDHVILVEGYMDVVSLTQFGVNGVCATLGTALTDEQARLLHRFAPVVYLAYDGDSAGQHAILRGLDILENADVPARVLVFPDGLDPDEFIRRDGPEAFSKLPALSPAVYRMASLKSRYDLSTRDGKLNYTRDCAKIILPLDPLERDTCIRDLSIETGFSPEIIMEEMHQLSGKKENEPAPAVPKKLPRARKPEDEAAPELTAQEMLLGLLSTGQIPKDMVSKKDFDDEELKSIYSGLVSGMSPAALIDTAPDEESRSRYVRILLTPYAESTDQLIVMAKQCLNRINRSSLQKQYDDLMKKIALLPAGDPDIKSCLLQAQDIQAKLKAL